MGRPYGCDKIWLCDTTTVDHSTDQGGKLEPSMSTELIIRHTGIFSAFVHDNVSEGATTDYRGVDGGGALVPIAYYC